MYGRRFESQSSSLEYQKRFNELYDAVSKGMNGVRLCSDEKSKDKLHQRLEKINARNTGGDVRRTSQFIRSLELVDDLFVATDFAVQQYQKMVRPPVTPSSSSTSTQPPPPPNPQKSTHHKRDKGEMIDISTEEESSLPNKKAKKQPFQSAKDRFKLEVRKPFRKHIVVVTSMSREGNLRVLMKELAMMDRDHGKMTHCLLSSRGMTKRSWRR